MDLSELNFTELSDEAKPLDILHPVTFLPIGIKLMIVGPESTKARHFNRQTREEMYEKARKEFLKHKKVDRLTDEEVDLMEARAAAAVIVGWEGLTDKGQPVPFSEEAAIKLMRQHHWMQRQVERHHKDDALFFGSKPLDSSSGLNTSSDSTPPTKTE